jgi:hypothetical protein
MARRTLLTLGVVGLLVGLIAPAASAQAFTQTETVHGFTETFPDFNPCTGDTGEVTVTYNGVFHITEDPNTGFHVTGTQTGIFEFTPDDPEAESFTGRFTVWFGGNTTDNNEGFWVTFKVKATGEDGSRFVYNAVEQIHFSNGELHVEFFNENCH